MIALLGMFEGEKVDVSAHLPIATQVALAGIVLLMAFFAVRPELWRRLWFDRVDPRPAACMRIFFGVVVLITFTDLLKPTGPLDYSVARYLFTDDGLWLTDMARKNYAGQLKTQWDPEHGVESWVDWFGILYDKFCIFHMRSDPPFVFTLYGVMIATNIAMILGWRTRVMTIITWILVENFYRTSPIFYTGGDTVVRVFLFLGMFARWGEAYSLDALRRRRKAILAGATAIPALRKIAAWPMRLMMLQLCIIYCATGLLKSGNTWADGTALYYALNLDHFYRFPQQHPVTVAHFIGVLPGMSVFVRWWEVFFPLVAIGAAVNAFERERAAGTWPRAPLWRKGLSWALLFATWGSGAFVAGLAAHYYTPPEVLKVLAPPVRDNLRVVVTVAVGALPVVLVALYIAMRRYVPRVLTFIRHWVIGKRFWLGFGFLMHIGIDVGMNVGTFAEVMMAVYLCWLSGDEIEAFWRYVYSEPLKAGEGDRPVRTKPWKRRLLAPWDRLRYRKPGRRYVVRHHPSDASVRRVALLRVWDLGHRLEFVADPSVAAEKLAVQVEDSSSTVYGDAAAGVLTKVLPGLLWLRPLRLVPGVGALARMILRQRG